MKKSISTFQKSMHVLNKYVSQGFSASDTDIRI